ncbi:hypothetical protein HY489_04120 [Candidatus Woesearchaeota archaeon]|nr:hypothetical protein [Candidatus Woesearchaeota archaeon]
MVLCSLLVSAQSATISVVSLRDQSQSTYLYLHPSQPQYFSLGSDVVVTKISVRSHSSYYGGGSLSLCLSFDSDAAQTCVPLQGSDINIPIVPRKASTAVFSVRGDVEYGGYYYVYINQVSWTSGPGSSVSRTYSSIGQSGPVQLGSARDFVAQQGTVTVSSSDSKVVAWFQDATALVGTVSPTSRTSTTHPDDKVQVCLNTDGNKDSQGAPVCDYVDAQNCNSRNRDWLLGHCCGDAPYAGCGFYGDLQALCGQDASGRFRWAPLSSVGVIFSLDTCPKADVVSNGQKFFTCSDVPAGMSNLEKFQGKVAIGGHEYACEGARVAECGGSSPFSAGAKKVGASLTIGGLVYQCGADGTWKQSFDADKASCVAAGLKWTGSKCCGELADSLSTYEDQYDPARGGDPGGCFKSSFVASGSSVAGNKDVVNYRGKFYLCEPDPSKPSTSVQLFQGTGVSLVKSGACGSPLQNALLSGSLPHVVCAPGGSWQFVSRTELHFAKSIAWQPFGVLERDGCCPEQQCWDGLRCRDRNEYQTVGSRGYKCR